MAFTGQGGAGQTVSQTAGTTDVNPSGISALAGVTTRVQGLLTIINLGGASLSISGDLTIDPRTHRLENVDNVTNNSGGTLRIGVQFASSFGGGTLYSQGDAITFNSVFTNNGTFNQLGAGMNATRTTGGTFHTFNGTVFMREAKWVTGVNNNHRLRVQTAIIDIDGLDTYGVQFDALMIPTTNTKLKNIRPANVGVGVENALNSGSGTTQTQTFDGVPSTIGKVRAVVSNWNGANDIRMTEVQEGSLEMIMPDNTGNTGTSGHGGLTFKKYQIQALTNLGAAIQGAVCYLKDTNNGLRKIKTIAGGVQINYTADQVQINQTGADGKTPIISVLICHIYRNNAVGDISAPDGNEIRDLRSKVNTAGVDTFDIYLLSYSQQITPLLDVAMKGLVLTSEPSKMATDTNVTLTEAQAVAKLASSFVVNSGANSITVTANSTLDNLYDAIKAWKTRPIQAQLEYPTISTQPIVANGDTLITAMQEIGIEFLTAGTKFKNLQSNATANSTFSNLSIIGNVTQATPTNLTNVQITGTLTYNTATNTSITLDSTTTIGTVVNNGTGIVTIQGGAIANYTDAEINYLDSSLTFDGVTSITFYPTQADANAGTNAQQTINTSPFNFKFGGSLQGLKHIRYVAGGVTTIGQLTIVLGANEFSLNQVELLSNLNVNLAKVNQNVITSSKFKTAKIII